MDPSDVELLRLAQAGNQGQLRAIAAGDAFHRLIDRHAPAMLRLALSLVTTQQDAEDLLQETFLAAFRAAATFQEKSSVKTWLYAILFRQAALLRRKKGIPHSSLPDDVPLPAPTHTQQVDAKLDLQAALAALPEVYRSIIILRELDGLSYDEIAELLQLPKGTVESRLHRARQALKIIVLSANPGLATPPPTPP